MASPAPPSPEDDVEIVKGDMSAREPPVVPSQPAARAAPAGWRWPSSEASLAVLAAVALCFVLWVGRGVLMPLAMAGIIAITLSPLVRRLERLGAGSAAAAAIVMVSLIALLALAMTRVLPSLEAFQNALPELQERIERRISSWETMFEPITEATEEVQQAIEGIAGAEGAEEAAVVRPAGNPTLTLLSGATTFLAQAAFTLVLIFFILAERRNLKAVIWRAFPNAERPHVRTAFTGMKTTISRYLLTVTVINAALGLVTALALSMIGFPQAPLWGMAVFVANFVPYVGPAVLQAGALVIGWINGDTLWASLAPFLVIWGLNLIEGQFLTPWIVGRQVVLNPLVVLLAIAMGGLAWGVAGMIVAVPILIVVTGMIKFWNAPAPATEDSDDLALEPFGAGNVPPGVLGFWFHAPATRRPVTPPRD